MKRILISVTNDLTTDQRVEKTCEVLSEIGYDVLLVGRKLKKSLPIQRNYKTIRFRLLFNKGFLFYAEFNIRLFIFLLFTKKDLLFSNDLDTLLPNYIIGKLQNKKLVFDSHELFSEIPELVNKQQVKKVWLLLEKTIIPKLQTVITVSDSIKKHYQNLYGISAIVIRNIPKIEHINQKNFEINAEGKKVILYQGSVNIGRGIELMIETMPLLEEYIFVIIGDGDIIAQLKEKVSNLSLHNKVKFLGKKTPEELKELTPNATIGMSLEEDLGLNYRYALPNKIFDYLHANVPVIIADLPEMRSLIKKHPIGEILIERTLKTLAKTIINMTNISYEKELKTAKKELNWSKEKEKLISIFSKLDK
ncbi:glycosyltransferase [Flavobacteriaceae bacterium]|nr:glycosyltransferase [Flavobacteriaceae bacterium]MDB4024929.1 glycosyltransferase [Flavobacteriaceae bacterium]MDB9780632.1 glycosyltransferase [Flavobacteriaceae bacterium]MDB9798752.1 glycosyltransferase [Flavobacteriaceae bacterium]